ncbi:MAG: Dabb family protein [Clostridia bacterium]|nr:Dabb family protein [Oscillospiraceae bacterium]MBQ7959944.1 Dabb family protein [Clostridia bacterium]
MVKHVIIWNFKEELTADEKVSAAAKIKAELEGLLGQIDGLTDIKVYTKPLASSSGDLILDSTFVDEEALKGYQVHPAHVEAATYVRSQVGSRACFDYEI